MNAHKTALARVVLTILAGMLFFSSWTLPAFRMAPPPPGALSYPQLKAFQKAVGAPATAKAAWTKLPAAEQRAVSQHAKVQLDQRLSRVVANPGRIRKSDVEAVRAAFGADSSKMLDILRQSAD